MILINRISGLAATLLLITACTPTDNPRLAMCQTMGKNLVGEISSWDNTEISETGNRMIINAAYTPASGQAGNINCVYQRDDENSAFGTAPRAVTLNGRKLGTKEILQAGTAATAEQFKKLAAETEKQSRELAKDVTKKAEELTEKAEVLAGQAEKKAGELAVQAKEIAVDTAEKVQQQLQNQ
ncbi:MAG: hypothetical protein KTR32_14275 [Granulosicoccus sp.]|nr:hypothetical protein [Granulosicoccus sp.]